MASRTLYQILQVDPSADQEVIEAAYRGLAKKYHPDLSSDPDATRIMQEINDAYKILRDPMERRLYDDALGASEVGRTEQSSGDQPRSEQTSSASQDTEYQSSRAHTPPNFPVACERCSASDASLRMAIFPYVVSVVILTFRRAWGGVYCSRCSARKMSEAKLLSLILGWWGFPFGIFYTLGVLFKPFRGDTPAEINGPYLRALGAYFLQVGRLDDAEQALKASLEFQHDPEVASVYQEIFHKSPGPKTQDSRARSSGWIAAFVGAILLIVIGIGLLSFTFRPTSAVPTSAVTSTTSSGQGVTVNSIWQQQTETEDGFRLDIPPNMTRKRSVLPDGRPRVWYASLVGQGFDGIAVTRSNGIGTLTSAANAEEFWRQVDESISQQQGVKVVLSPAIESMNARRVLRYTLDVALPDGGSVRIHKAMVPAEGRSYILAVQGSAAIDSDLQEILDRLLRSFVPIPSQLASATRGAVPTTRPLATSRPRGLLPTPRPQNTRPKNTPIAPVRQADGYLVGNLEWKVLGYTLVDKASRMELQMTFHSMGARMPVPLDFQLIADGQQYSPGGPVQIAYLHPNGLAAGGDRTAKGDETIEPNGYVRVTLTFATPQSCMSAGGQIDGCMRNKETKVRWLKYGIELPASLR